MGYSVDLKNIRIEDYKQILKETELIPSWKILEKNIDKNLTIIKQKEVNNLDELLLALKDKDSIQAFSKQSGLSIDYLQVLKRVVGGYRRKPNRIQDFPNITENIVRKLAEIGIRNTAKLYQEVMTPESRNELARNTGLEDTQLMILTKLTDLSRIRWVNHTFAYVLLEAGYDTARKVANADYSRLYETIKQLNEERKIYNAHIGIRDMKMAIEAAKMLDFEIEY